MNKTWFIKQKDYTPHNFLLINGEIAHFSTPTRAYIAAAAKNLRLNFPDGEGCWEVVSYTPEQAGFLYRCTLPDQPPPPPWDRDITGELARNPGPWPLPDKRGPSAMDRSGGWWKRELHDIEGLTFHHTLSHSPHATASYYINKKSNDGIGRPSIPYHIWITEIGQVLLCLNLEEGCWHDHTGHENKYLSVGLAGSLHLHKPSDQQLAAAAKVAVWAIEDVPLTRLVDISDISGHLERAWAYNKVRTVCPGWIQERSGYWKGNLYKMIEEMMDNG